MMLIGTSFGACIKSIAMGEVSESDVLLIITRTKAENLAQMLEVSERYYNLGNPYTLNPSEYAFDKEKISLDEIHKLVARLYEAGKIHQPRLFGVSNGVFIHDDINTVWLEVNPLGLNANPIVVEAYQKYRMLDNLTK